jgi:hypothetical protein
MGRHRRALILVALAATVALMVGCAPMPKKDSVSLEDCQKGNPRCTLCVNSTTGEGDWYSDITFCPSGTYQVFIKGVRK